MTLWDAIVVGAGGSGAPLARTLADHGHRVLLLEAGPDPGAAAPGSANSLASAMPGHPLAWTYPSRLTNTHEHDVVRGRAVGGSTAINGTYFRRARAHDLERWSRLSGDDRWMPAAVAEDWQSLETDLEFGDRPQHGSRGPITITRASRAHPLAAALLGSARALGIPEDPDKNSDDAPGAGLTPTNSDRGTRVDSATAFLTGHTPTLEVRAQQRVTNVLWSSPSRARAEGVRVMHGGRARHEYADVVILACGAIASAHLLQLSGVGPADVLTPAGIEPLLVLPVGAGFSDHPNVDLQFRWSGPVSVPDDEPALGVSVHGSSGVDNSSVAGDVEALSFHTPLGRMLGTDPESTTMSLLCSALVSAGRGTLISTSPDPDTPPALHFHYRESAEERDRLRAAVRLGAALLTTETGRAHDVQPEGWTLADIEDDARIDRWIDAHLSTALHTCGTTPMGKASDPRAVVDGAGRIHGATGLVIADAGILPDTPTGGPAATAALIGRVIGRSLL